MKAKDVQFLCTLSRAFGDDTENSRDAISSDIPQQNAQEVFQVFTDDNTFVEVDSPPVQPQLPLDQQLPE